jgi:hypothetical protein
LKEVFLIVAAIKGQLGFKWDDEKGADIGPESEAVWEEYVKVYSMILLQILSSVTIHFLDTQRISTFLKQRMALVR